MESRKIEYQIFELNDEEFIEMAKLFLTTKGIDCSESSVSYDHHEKITLTKETSV